MPLFLLAALFLAFGADSVVPPVVVPPESVPFRVEVVVGLVAVVGVLARLVSVAVGVRSRNPGWRSVPGPRWLFRWGSKLVAGLTLGGYAWGVLVLSWPEVVRSVWGWRDSVLVDELLILAPFLIAQLAGWWGLAGGDQMIRAGSGSLLGSPPRPISAIRYVVGQARQSLGMVLPAALIFAFGQDLARVIWPTKVADPDFQLGLMIVLGGGVLVLAPAFVRLSWPTYSLPPGPLRDRLERVAARYRFRCSDILVWDTDGAAVNAGVTGASPWYRYVLLTDALIDGLNDHEIAAVFGHEVGHARHRHLAFFGLFFVGSVGVITLAGATLDERFVRVILPLAARPAWATAAQGASVLLVALAYFGLVFGHLSRRFERQADVFGCRAVSCDQPDCPPHLDPQALPPSTLARLDKTAPICPVGLRTFINALRAVASLNGIDPTARSWRHGSIARRVAFLETLENHPEAERRFQSSVNRLRVALALILALALVLAFETGAIDQLGS